VTGEDSSRVPSRSSQEDFALEMLGCRSTLLAAMPLYEYIASDPETSCRVCARGFELRRPLDRPALARCPLCSSPVTKLLPRNVSQPRISAPLSVSDAKRAGFTVLEKRDEGVYEKL